VDTLIQKALENGGTDNVSVILVQGERDLSMQGKKLPDSMDGHNVTT
jgi:serine/threonine protein phosphatase PrpC